MFRIALATATIVTLMSSAALAATMIKEIDARVDLAAIENQGAAERFANIEGDLESALAVRLVERIAEAGVRVIIDVSEVELSNAFLESVALADTRLVGDVRILDGDDEVDAYKVTVNIDQARVFFPADLDVVTLTPSSDTYYDAMIAAFATTVAERLMN